MLNRKENKPAKTPVVPEKFYLQGFGLFGIGRFAHRVRKSLRTPASCIDLSCCILLRHCKAIQGNQRSDADLPTGRSSTIPNWPWWLSECSARKQRSTPVRSGPHSGTFGLALMTNVTRRELVCPALTTLSNRQERCSVMPAIRAFSHSGTPFIRDHNTRNP